MRQAQPSTQDSVSGRGDLPIAGGNLRVGAGSRRGSLLFVTQRSDRAPVCIVNAWRASRKED